MSEEAKVNMQIDLLNNYYKSNPYLKLFTLNTNHVLHNIYEFLQKNEIIETESSYNLANIPLIHKLENAYICFFLHWPIILTQDLKYVDISNYMTCLFITSKYKVINDFHYTNFFDKIKQSKEKILNNEFENIDTECGFILSNLPHLSLHHYEDVITSLELYESFGLLKNLTVLYNQTNNLFTTDLIDRISKNIYSPKKFTGLEFSKIYKIKKLYFPQLIHGIPTYFRILFSQKCEKYFSEKMNISLYDNIFFVKSTNANNGTNDNCIIMNDK